MNTNIPKLVRVEAVADLPVLWEYLQGLQISTFLGQMFPPGPRWKGDATPADILSVWILFILSENDHRLNQVQPWVEQHQLTLAALIGKSIRPLDFHDDRLAYLLDRLDDPAFTQFEDQLNQHTLRVYDLPSNRVRIDMTTANSYADVVSEDGLLQFGHSKDDPSRPQLKVAVAALDPLGMPLATAVLPGNSADDPLYIPAIEAIHRSLGKGGRTYIGDCKMAAFATRLFLARSGDFYLCPLSQLQLSEAARFEQLQAVWQGDQKLETVTIPGKKPEDPAEEIAQGFSVQVTLQDGDFSWQERHWYVRSLAYATTQEERLEVRLTKAKEQLEELPIRRQGKKVRSAEQLQEAAAKGIAKNKLEGLLSYQWMVDEAPEISSASSKSYTILVHRNETAIAKAKREMGWQVYAENQPGSSLAEVLGAYRGQYCLERLWSRLKGKPFGLTPIYLQSEERIRSLVNLLSICLRIWTLLEYVVKRKLSDQSEKPLEKIYSGQGGRKTRSPSVELLLRAMSTLTLSVIEVDGKIYVLLSPMTPTQKRLLQLWGLPIDLYEQFAKKIQNIAPD